MQLSALETAIASKLAPMQADGFRVLGAPTDHQEVGRTFGKGEVRVAYQQRNFKPSGGLVGQRKAIAPYQLIFEVVVELQDVRLQTQKHAAEAMERVLSLIAGFVPDAECGAGLYPIRDGFVGRDKETATWIYSATFGLDRKFSYLRSA